MVIKRAEYVTGAAYPAQLIGGDTPEIAVAGRSNVGKSSFINLITGNSKLAKTSKDPGARDLSIIFRSTAANSIWWTFPDTVSRGFPTTKS